MNSAKTRLLVCSCEKTMPLDAQAIGRGCAAKVTQADQLCGADLGQFKAAVAEGDSITVACTQEAPLFKEVAEEVKQRTRPARTSRPGPTFSTSAASGRWT